MTTHDARGPADWLTAERLTGRFHTGPIGPAFGAIGTDDLQGKPQVAAAKGGNGTPVTVGLGADHLKPPPPTTVDGFAEPTATLFPDGPGESTIGHGLSDPKVQRQVDDILAPLPNHLRQTVLRSPRSDFVPVMADVAGALTLLLADRLPKQSLTLSLLDRLDALPPATRCRVLVDTLASLPIGPLAAGAPKQIEHLRERLQSAAHDLQRQVEAQLPQAIKDAMALLPAPVQQRLLLEHVDSDLATGEYVELGGSEGAAERIRQNLLGELNRRCHLRPDNTSEPPPGVSDALFAALAVVPPATACRILTAALTVPPGEDAGPEAVGKRLKAAARPVLAAALPEPLRLALTALPPDVQERVLTTGVTAETADDPAALVQANLEDLAKQVIARLPADRQPVARRMLGLPGKPPPNPDLPVPPTTHPATLCAFLAGVRVPEAPWDTLPTLTATDQQQALQNLVALEGEAKQATAAIAKLDPDSADMVKAMLGQGLVTARELLTILQPDGTLPPTTAAACDRLMTGMATLITERLHLTAADTFSPPIDQADAQGSRWQVAQIVGIAHTVLQGLRDGLATSWQGLHFQLEVPAMPNDAKLLDRDIGRMRYGHFDQGIPGKPPTMVLSAQDSNPEASTAVQQAWKDLWSEIMTGRHRLRNGDPTAQKMATMLQGYLQEQQIDWIGRHQAPMVRALALHVEKTAKTGTGPERDFAARLLTTSSGLRSDAIANLWALHQLARQAQDPASPDPDGARRRLADFLGTISRTGPEADSIRLYLATDLKGLDPDRSVDSWLAGADGHARRQTEQVQVKAGDNLSVMLDRAGGNHGPAAILQFLRQNAGLTGRFAITVGVPEDQAKKLQLHGKRVNGVMTYSAADFVATIEADRQRLWDLQTRGGVAKGPGSDPQRHVSLSETEARRIGFFVDGHPGKTISAQRLWELSQLALARNSEAVIFANVTLITGATVEMPSRTWNYGSNPSRQMEIDHVDARTLMLGYVGRSMQAELLTTPRVGKSLASDIQALQHLAPPLQEDGLFGPQTQAAMRRLEMESGMTTGFDPTTWYRHMLKTAMPTTSNGQNFWVALTSHEMIGHGTEEGLLRQWAADVPGLGSADDAYTQAFQLWGYGVFGFLDGNGRPPKPGDDDALMNDPRTVAAHATVGTESLADGLYTFNPGAQFITPYAKSSPAEAWAESLRFFTQRPEKLLADSPAAFLFINEVTHRFTASQIMAMGALPQVFASPAAAASRIGLALDQLTNVQQVAINPAIVRHLATSLTILALRDQIAGGDTDQTPIERTISLAKTGNAVGAGVVGPEQRALNRLLDDPAKATAWAAAAAPLQPFSDDPKHADNAVLLTKAREALAAIGLPATEVNAVPPSTLLRWLAEANDFVAMAYVRQTVTKAGAETATADDKTALETLWACLMRVPGTSPEAAFPPGVWQTLSSRMQDRLTDVLFLGDLRGAGQPIPRGTYNLTMTRPSDLVNELGLERLAERRKGYDRLQNQVQTLMWTVVDGSREPQQANGDLAQLVPLILSDVADSPRLLAAYRQYLDQLAASLDYYAKGGTTPPPTGLTELYDTTKDGIAAATALVTGLRQHLGLSPTPTGVH